MSMYQSKNWPRLRSRFAWRLALALVLCLMLTPLVAPVVAQAPAAQAPLAVRVTTQEALADFSTSLTFKLSFESDASVAEAILFYGLDGERLVRRIYPSMSPGGTRLEHVEELEAGQYAPGARLRYWWRLLDASGRSYDTPVAYLMHNDERFDWQLLSSASGQLQLHWYGDRQDLKQAQEILDAAQNVIEVLKGEMGVASEDAIQIWVYNTQRDMSAALSSRSDAYDELIMTLGVAIGQDTLLLLGSHRDVLGTVAHELSHIVTHMATDNPYSSIPRWLDEGLAMVASGELTSDNANALKQAIKDDELLSVRSMTSYSGRAELVDLYYGEVHSVVSFMLERYGRDRMQALLQTMAQGVAQEDALQAVCGLSLAQLDDDWRVSLGLEPRPALQPSSQAVQRGLCLALPLQRDEVWR